MVTCSDISFLSGFFSTLSCTSWIFAQLPQIVTNYQNKSAEGISPSFLLLWFLGDFLSFTSCLLNDAVLQFQLYLSVFFLCNDVTLCFQYYYYNSVYPRKYGVLKYAPVSGDEAVLVGGSEINTVSVHSNVNAVHIRHGKNQEDQDGKNSPESSISSTPSSYNSINDNGKPSVTRSAAFAVVLNAAGTAAMPIMSSTDSTGDEPFSSKETLGLVLAWGCTVVYMASRCPQLYKNYMRKSVDGISPVLFGAALLGNLTYTLSILTSCEFVFGNDKSEFIMKELPYIIGSSGTIVFDIAYFYQKFLYKNTGKNTLVMSMENWSHLNVSGKRVRAPY
ncbi:PQ loop repeat-domain-containing protein [Scheffersomyces xylosifermentans]|uniref:PQ loop repeat-domain-containing protein n=1 Tax=Scheffersomyces xylosifermentans TaxID=1304137 RepID=UPI00315CBA42